MRLLAMTILPLVLAGGAASAQVGDLTGDVTGQVSGTVNSTTRLDSTLNGTANTVVDSRTGAALDADLVSDLDSSLRTHSMAHANAQLRSALRSNARAYSRTRVHGHARVHGPSVRTRTYGSTRMRAGQRGHARVYVYTRDGHRVGYVDETGRRQIFVRSTLDAHSDARVQAVSTGDAAFDPDAYAVVLAMTRAEFAGMAGLQ